jgi:hypothetical protein
MTSLRQIEANRRNALRSTGPGTAEGKQRSRQNAIRHGLCAETVVQLAENAEDYRGFEAAIIADYDARTAVERELVLRLASLLWRLRRATSIETDLLRIQAEILRDRRENRRLQDHSKQPHPRRLRVLGGADQSVKDWDDNRPTGDEPCDTPPTPSPPRDLTHGFQRLASFDNGLLERLGRYETALWRQVTQILFVLQSAKLR